MQTQPSFLHTALRSSSAVRIARVVLVTLLLSLCAGLASAEPAPAGSELVDASQASVRGSVYVTRGSVALLATVGDLTLSAIEVTADGVLWVLEGVADATGEIIELTVRAVGGVSMAVGTTIEVVGMSAGWVLEAAGSVIGFVPNALGESLYHSAVH